MTTGVGTLPAPIGGMNALDSIVGMPETDAISLINFFPQAYGCYLRKGYQEFANGFPSDVQTLLPYADKGGTTKLYAFSGAGLYDATAGGAVGAALVSGLTSAQWQCTLFATSGGTNAACFNGIDNGIWISTGSGIQRLIAGDGVTVSTIKNVDPKNVIDCVIHQRRLWMVEKNTTYGWYLPTDQIYGIASQWDFGPLFKKGGYLQSLATWTVDGGSGSDDVMVAFSSEGEIAIYKGTDPSTAPDNWALQGVYFVGKPVSGHRFHTKVGGDVKFVTSQGIISLNDMFTSNTVTVANSSIDSQKVQQPISDSVSLLGSIFGWEAYYCAPFNMFMVNIPSVVSGGNLQYVENTINSGWCQFTGYDASHLATYNGVPFFGCRDGKIYAGWTGHVDKAAVDGSGGTEVVGVAQQAYSYLQAPAVQKQIGMYRPTFLKAGDIAYGSLVAYDFAFSTAPVIFSPSGTSGAAWDVALWDAAYWSGSLLTQRDWNQAEGMGVAVSFCLTVRSKAETLWVATDYTSVISNGGVF
jgi:hypothetical protein